MEGPAEDERVEGWSSGAVPTRESGGELRQWMWLGQRQGELSLPRTRGLTLSPVTRAAFALYPPSPVPAPPGFCSDVNYTYISLYFQQ